MSFCFPDVTNVCRLVKTGYKASGGLTVGMIVAASIVLECDSATRAKLNTSRSRQPGTSFWQDALMDWHTAKPWVFALQLLEWSLQLAAYYTSVLLGKVGMGFIAAGYGRLSTLLPTGAISSLGCFALWLSLILSDANRGERGPFITYLMLDGLFASAFVCLSLTSRIIAQRTSLASMEPSTAKGSQPTGDGHC